MAKPRSTAPRETTADPDAQNQADGDDDADEDVEKDGDAENGLGEVSAGAGDPIDVDGAEGALRPDVVARPRRAAGASGASSPRCGATRCSRRKKSARSARPSATEGTARLPASSWFTTCASS